MLPNHPKESPVKLKSAEGLQPSLGFRRHRLCAFHISTVKRTCYVITINISQDHVKGNQCSRYKLIHLCCMLPLKPPRIDSLGDTGFLSTCTAMSQLSSLSTTEDGRTLTHWSRPWDTWPPHSRRALQRASTFLSSMTTSRSTRVGSRGCVTLLSNSHGAMANVISRNPTNHKLGG